MTYRILPLPLAPFRPLFGFDDHALEARGARRMIAQAPRSAPCRVSLEDAEPGERLILLNHAHLIDNASPYRSGGPIFVREKASETLPIAGALPEMLSRRLLSLRAYDANWMMVDAEIAEGAEIERWMIDRLGDPSVQTIHIHTARRGCYMAAAERLIL